jgi:hypothetical protein
VLLAQKIDLSGRKSCCESDDPATTFKVLPFSNCPLLSRAE